MKNVWYYLDPDNRREAPEGLHCARCMKKLSAASGAAEGGFFAIIIDKEGNCFRRAGVLETAKPPFQNGMIGNHCFRETQKWGTFTFDGKDFIQNTQS